MRYRPDEKTEELNLIPVMNLVTILIPFALLSAQFVVLAVIDVNVPTINPEPVPEFHEPLRVSIGAQGFELGLPDEFTAIWGTHLPARNAAEQLQRCNDGELEPRFAEFMSCLRPDPQGCRVRVHIDGTPVCPDLAKAQELPWQQMVEVATELKKAYPEEEALVIGASDDVRYEDLVHLMDVTRSAPTNNGEEWLFPTVTLAMGQ